MPNRYKDTVCELTKNKNTENRTLEAEHEELLDSMGLSNRGVEKGNKEVSECIVNEVELTGNDFPTLDESIGKKGSPEKAVNVSTDTTPTSPLNADTVSVTNKVCESSDVNNSNKTDGTLTKVGKTFADTVKPNKVDVLNKLSWIPTVMDEGREVVMFDAELILEGSNKWMLTLCGHLKQKINCSKFVKMEYSWRPPRCNEFKVFGHNCALNKEAVAATTNASIQNAIVGTKGGNKNFRRRQEFRPVNKQPQASTSGAKDPGSSSQDTPKHASPNVSTNQNTPKPTSLKSPWKVSQTAMEEIKRSANNQRKPSLEDLVKWNTNMHTNFREQWKEKWNNALKWNDECPEIEDVLDEVNGIAQSMTENELDGKASNSGRERKVLWSTLKRYKSIVNDSSWVLMGDWNECLNHIEVEDLNYTGVHFTWVQSRRNPNSGILKKIDRVLVAMMLYKAAVTPLKLTLRDTANGQFTGKFFMFKTKQTVLNQGMLPPADKDKMNTYKVLRTRHSLAK
ncbi:RNA-directed DNA polymerase, eukaryota, Reverse transcriptase zinc-binding domain protein [Artemisia annua]|uniref:RNA-directed DNA polymerase, eukaryota, Reverse transcriptase zinc-binding domain protein n=1 Tax=Artemisia annua TaxID=35608 RepID=A0A2U1NIS5_ARTAN|nr:RNA-directed DNA polymerase, eukaryota, Reverse transcriptase zinc-binding domain protein [Artemisia annua]